MYKAIHGNEIPSMLSCIARVAKVCDYSNIKILIRKQMIQKLPIVFAQAGNTSENLLN